MEKLEPEANVSAPVLRIAVLPLPVGPGARFAPLLATFTVPLMVPLPPRVVPLLLTVTAEELEVLPFTNSVPPFTVVAPV